MQTEVEKVVLGTSFLDCNIKLSCREINGILTKSREEATQVNLWDKFLDLFRSVPKAAVLSQLYDIVDNLDDKDYPNRTLAYRFHLLRNMMDDSEKFRMSICGKKMPDGKYLLTYNLILDNKKYQIVSETVNHAHLENAKACWGEFPVYELESTSLLADLHNIEQLTLSVPEPVLSLIDSEIFTSDTHGCNKKYQHCARFGMLQIPAEKAEKELKPEHYIDQLSQQHTEIQRYVSPQRRLAHEKTPRLRDDKHTYALVCAYNPNEVKTTTLQDVLKDRDNPLSLSERKNIARQIVDFLRISYKNNFSHGDLHTGNIQFIRENPPAEITPHNRGAERKGYIRIFDFGRLEKDSDFIKNKNRDIDYLFSREGDGFLETLARNKIISKDSAKYQKHYPLHHLLEGVNLKGIDCLSHLDNIGSSLKKALSFAVTEDDVDLAFANAASEILCIMDFVTS